MAASGPLTPGASPAAGASAPLPRVTFPFWRWLVTVMVEPLASPSNASDFKAPFKERARRETRKCCLRSPCASDRTAERGGGAPCPAPGLGLRVSVAEDLGHCLLTPGPPSLFASSIRSLVHPSTATRGSHRLRPVRPHVGTSDFRACDGEGEKLGWSGRWGWGSGLTQQRPGGRGAAAGAGGRGRVGREVTPGLWSGVAAESCPTLHPHGLRCARLPCPPPSPGARSNSSPSSR